MIVYVTDRNGARTRKPLQPFVWISISTPGDPAAPVTEGSSGVLRLWFHDLETAPGESFGRVYGPHRLFNDTMAREVIRFVLDASRRGVQIICVHCDAGVSRSGAVAMWLRDTFGAHVASDRQLSPNARVRRMLDQAWQRTAAQ
jgi:predicted protein tyrosine phosphatase